MGLRLVSHGQCSRGDRNENIVRCVLDPRHFEFPSSNLRRLCRRRIRFRARGLLNRCVTIRWHDGQKATDSEVQHPRH